MTGRRLSGDQGDITLPGLLVSIVLSLVILTAVLDVFAGAQTEVTRLTVRNDQQQEARRASDAMARALRNLASPTPEQPQAIDRAGAFDLIFQDVDPNGPNTGQNLTNVQRERWCLGAQGTLYSQRQTWTTAAVPATPTDTACPGTGWASTGTVSQGLSNIDVGLSRPVFTYDAAALTDIAAVHVDLYAHQVNRNGAAETHLTTGVFLRNQNRRPAASFTAVSTAQGIVLNASASSDPEGQALTYTWLDGSDVVDTGVTTTYKVTPGTSHTLSVRVEDPAHLTATSPTQVVVG